MGLHYAEFRRLKIIEYEIEKFTYIKSNDKWEQQEFQKIKRIHEEDDIGMFEYIFYYKEEGVISNIIIIKEKDEFVVNGIDIANGTLFKAINNSRMIKEDRHGTIQIYEKEVKKINCLECDCANLFNNKCELTNKDLYYKGEQLTKECNLFKEATGNYNEEREVKNE